jgi:eukaryotic-like serine/threonine-protein kinase
MLSSDRIERYELLGELATGGMATVYLGRQRGPFGFMRTVAIKSMHPQFAKDEDFRAMFLDEAMLTARIRHPNVVPTLDIVCAETKVLLVMEYVDGVSLAALVRSAARTGMGIPAAVAVAILCDALHGLHAAHELVDDDGKPLHVVHRDVSPQNIHVGVDGLARVLDFGVAKAATRRYVTVSGEVKGKLAYMAQEQICGGTVDRRSDVYAAGVVVWEALAGRRLYEAANEGELVKKVLEGNPQPPSFFADEELPAALDRVVMKALSKEAADRYASADDFARALAEALPPAPRNAVTTLVRTLAGPELASRASRLRTNPSPQELEPEAKQVAQLLTEHVTQTFQTPAFTKVPAVAKPPKNVSIVISALVGFALLLLAAAGMFVVRSARIRAASAARASASVPAVIATTPTESTASARPETSAEPSARASASVTPPAPPMAKRPGRKPVPTTTHASAHPPVKTTTSCNPPFTVDANGDRHYKPECVE